MHLEWICLGKCSSTQQGVQVPRHEFRFLR